MEKYIIVIIIVVVVLLVLLLCSSVIGGIVYFINKNKSTDTNTTTNTNTNTTTNTGTGTNINEERNDDAIINSDGKFNSFNIDTFDYYNLITPFVLEPAKLVGAKGKISDPKLIEMIVNEGVKYEAVNLKLKIGSLYNIDESSIKYEIILPNKDKAFIASSHSINDLLYMGLPVGTTVIYKNANGENVSKTINLNTKLISASQFK